MLASNFRKTLFPLSEAYDRSWITQNSLGENVLYNLESLTEIIEFREGMRVLDLGCGTGVSAIFLAKEFGVEVWAVDQYIPPSENFRRIKEMNCEHCVFPLKLNARELPFPPCFFDVIVAVDSYMYFGTDEKFTPYISQFLKPGGIIGIVDICFIKEINYLMELPDFLRHDYQDKWYFVHSIEWWAKMWNKTGHLKILNAEITPHNEFIKAEYVRDFSGRKKKDAIAEALEKDKEGLINIFRMTAQRSEKLIDMGSYSAEI
ncbi:MAG: methyltransferase domain-containing protein [Ignavibacteria bacterium]|nr:methyltransferase domain-containing protein [Ignavibacteria bacterium]